MLQLITTKPGDKYRSIKNPAVYEALRRQGMSKQRAARISNAQARKRHKSYTLDQLEQFVQSPAYDPDTAAAIAARIPELPRLKGEQIAPGITRIRGNLCNVHGRYGKCPGASAAPAKKPIRGRKPRQTPEQRAAERQQQRQANVDAVAKRMAETDTGLSPSGVKALTAFAAGEQPNATMGEGMVKMGLAERAQDGSYRMTPTGRAVISAMRAGDYQRAVDAISRGADAANARQQRNQERMTRQTAAAGKRSAAQMARELAKRERDAKRQQREQEQAKRGAGGSKKPAAQAKPVKRRPRALIRSGSSAIPSGGGSSAAPKPKPKPERQQPAVASPALTETAQRLSDGKELSEQDTQALIRNGLARLNKDGALILTAAGQRAIRQKDYSFRVFKDASGHYRWVSQSSTAYQDRDQEIVSTKALADDVARADADGQYGPLRWWHSPGLDLGDCDFNAMHGRVLIESGTFRSEAIALKVARAAPSLEISLGFLHLPTEPTPDGVFHHIRRFERSLVPRGKASNRFTAFAVKESAPMDATKVAALKTLGFSDSDIADIEARANTTEKTADDAQTAYKAEEPAPQEVTIAGVTYQLIEKAAPPPIVEEQATEEVVETDAIDEMPVEEPEPEGGLTLSPEDLTAIGEAVGGAVVQALQQALAPMVGLLDIEKKMQGHVESLMGGYQATKDAEAAEAKQQIAQLTQQVAELTGDAPAVPYRASQARDSALVDSTLLAAVKDVVEQRHPFEDLKRHLIGNGQA